MEEEPIMKDSHGIVINIGDEVEVSAPDYNDIYLYDFNGTVEVFKDGYAIVSDVFGDHFSIEPSRLTVVNYEEDPEWDDID